MADFRDLRAYQLARASNKQIFLLLRNSSIDRFLRDQLMRASVSILLNIAEGAGRFSVKEKRHFFIIARASAMECMAILDVLEDVGFLDGQQVGLYREALLEVCKVLFGLIAKLEQG